MYSLYLNYGQIFKSLLFYRHLLCLNNGVLAEMTCKDIFRQKCVYIVCLMSSSIQGADSPPCSDFKLFFVRGQLTYRYIFGLYMYFLLI